MPIQLTAVRAFRHNTSTDPQKSMVANRVCTLVEDALKNGNRYAIDAALKEWQVCISAPPTNYKVGGSEALSIAKNWLLEQGYFHPRASK